VKRVAAPLHGVRYGELGDDVAPELQDRRDVELVLDLPEDLLEL
jgi:hypothetical protein